MKEKIIDILGILLFYGGFSIVLLGNTSESFFLGFGFFFLTPVYPIMKQGNKVAYVPLAISLLCFAYGIPKLIFKDFYDTFLKENAKLIGGLTLFIVGILVLNIIIPSLINYFKKRKVCTYKIDVERFYIYYKKVPTKNGSFKKKESCKYKYTYNNKEYIVEYLKNNNDILDDTFKGFINPDNPKDLLIPIEKSTLKCVLFISGIFIFLGILLICSYFS